MEVVLLIEETSGLLLSCQKDSSDWKFIALVHTKMWLICIFLIVLYFSWGTSEQRSPTHTQKKPQMRGEKSHILLYKCMCSWLASWSNVGVRWRRPGEACKSGPIAPGAGTHLHVVAGLRGVAGGVSMGLLQAAQPLVAAPILVYYPGQVWSVSFGLDSLVLIQGKLPGVFPKKR